MGLRKDEIGCFEVRMVVTAAVGGAGTALNSLTGAPLEAGHALLAVMLPGGMVFLNNNIPDRADFCADAATITFRIGEKFVVALWKLPDAKTINETGQKDAPKPGSAINQA